MCVIVQCCVNAHLPNTNSMCAQVYAQARLRNEQWDYDIDRSFVVCLRIRLFVAIVSIDVT